MMHGKGSKNNISSTEILKPSYQYFPIHLQGELLALEGRVSLAKRLERKGFCKKLRCLETICEVSKTEKKCRFLEYSCHSNRLCPNFVPLELKYVLLALPVLGLPALTFAYLEPAEDCSCIMRDFSRHFRAPHLVFLQDTEESLRPIHHNQNSSRLHQANPMELYSLFLLGR